MKEMGFYVFETDGGGHGPMCQDSCRCAMKVKQR